MQIICGNCFSQTTSEKNACPFCNQSFKNSNPENALPFNSLLNDRYTVNSCVSFDSEGILYNAIDSVTKKLVMIKEFLPQGLCMTRVVDIEVVPQEGKEVLFKTIRMDFKELYELLKRISESESGLVHVLDVFEQNSTVYGVCEKVNGPSLREYVSNSLSEINHKQIAMLLHSVAKSVESLHRLGIIHRGISPDTVFLLSEGRAVLGGFATLGVRTLGSELVHSLYDGYAAPEQYSVAEFDGNYTDVYALGAIFYFVLSKGKEPQPSNKRRREDKLIPLRNLSKSVPSFVSHAVSRAMRISPVERTQSPTELINAVEHPQKNSTGLTSVQKIIIISIGITLACFVMLAFGLFYALNNQPIVSDSSSISETPIISVPQELISPDLVGNLYVDVQNDPDYLGKFHFPITEQFDSNYKKGEIMEQNPAPGEIVGEDGIIRLVVSAGPKTALMPDLKGMTQEEAISVLNEIKIKYTVANIVNDGSLITNTVVRTNYEMGDTLIEGESEVILYIAKEPVASSSSEITSTTE